ncbi:glycosyltransferase [Marinobacter nauticus]|uniref:glycosyltransferase n=1 Tax=Marinobacter nauticus TaxID=2743 RepID=UPI001C9A10BD|nr:glycosyltransferase [Marinobacter nauticus]MBY5937702.1 glycosyltransferase [Marinobacter nauticus]MBY5954930.1 glycosyltransferase [Marinobacter nauticus]MBY6008723.1 glycosyltransferase [Marinobacter nauticus]
MSLIVTLTSTSVRLPFLRHTLLSILDQNIGADRIVICISKEPYLVDEGIKKLPAWLMSMVRRQDVEVNWVENTGPYRKLLPVYRSSSEDDWIVTCDDDVIYGPEWLSHLVLTAKQNPSAIVCGRARRPVENLWGRRQGYLNWQLVPLGSRGKDLLPIGIAGVLYRKPLLDQATMYSEDYKKIAPKQDDLWFNFARQQLGSEVVVSSEAGKYVYPIEAPGSLSVTNAMTKVWGWDKLFILLFDRLVLKFKSYLGVPVCDNDNVIEQLDRYRKSLSKLT